MASIEVEKVYKSSRDTHKILKGVTQNTNTNQKFCSICKKKFHFTSQYRYANNSLNTGNKNRKC